MVSLQQLHDMQGQEAAQHSAPRVMVLGHYTSNGKQGRGPLTIALTSITNT